jgi:hypothetical protein
MINSNTTSFVVEFLGQWLQRMTRHRRNEVQPCEEARRIYDERREKRGGQSLAEVRDMADRRIQFVEQFQMAAKADDLTLEQRVAALEFACALLYAGWTEREMFGDIGAGKAGH